MADAKFHRRRIVFVFLQFVLAENNFVSECVCAFGVRNPVRDDADQKRPSESELLASDNWLGNLAIHKRLQDLGPQVGTDVGLALYRHTFHGVLNGLSRYLLGERIVDEAQFHACHVVGNDLGRDASYALHQFDHICVTVLVSHGATVIAVDERRIEGELGEMFDVLRLSEVRGFILGDCIGLFRKFLDEGVVGGKKPLERFVFGDFGFQEALEFFDALRRNLLL